MKDVRKFFVVIIIFLFSSSLMADAKIQVVTRKGGRTSLEGRAYAYLGKKYPVLLKIGSAGTFRVKIVPLLISPTPQKVGIEIFRNKKLFKKKVFTALPTRRRWGNFYLGRTMIWKLTISMPGDYIIYGWVPPRGSIALIRVSSEKEKKGIEPFIFGGYLIGNIYNSLVFGVGGQFNVKGLFKSNPGIILAGSIDYTRLGGKTDFSQSDPQIGEFEAHWENSMNIISLGPGLNYGLTDKFYLGFRPYLSFCFYHTSYYLKQNSYYIKRPEDYNGFALGFNGVMEAGFQTEYGTFALAGMYVMVPLKSTISGVKNPDQLGGVVFKYSYEF